MPGGGKPSGMGSKRYFPECCVDFWRLGVMRVKSATFMTGDGENLLYASFSCFTCSVPLFLNPKYLKTFANEATGVHFLTFLQAMTYVSIISF